MGQGFALEKFHHQIRGVIFLEHIEHPHDAGMLKAGQGTPLLEKGFFLSLKLETLDQHLQTCAARTSRKALFERNGTLELGIHCRVGDAKPSLP